MIKINYKKVKDYLDYYCDNDFKGKNIKVCQQLKKYRSDFESAPIETVAEVIKAFDSFNNEYTQLDVAFIFGAIIGHLDSEGIRHNFYPKAYQALTGKRL